MLLAHTSPSRSLITRPQIDCFENCPSFRNTSTTQKKSSESSSNDNIYRRLTTLEKTLLGAPPKVSPSFNRRGINVLHP